MTDAGRKRRAAARYEDVSNAGLVQAMWDEGAAFSMTTSFAGHQGAVQNRELIRSELLRRLARTPHGPQPGRVEIIRWSFREALFAGAEEAANLRGERGGRGVIQTPWRILERNEKSNPDLLEVQDGEGWWCAYVKRDGCIDFWRFHNEPWGGADDNPDADGQNVDYLHICDLDDLIKRLQALKVFAETHFETWPE